MNGGDILSLLTVFVLAAFVGFEVIAKVPSILHTPLMSGTNAIHGVVLVGSMIVLGEGHGALQLTLGFLAVVLATLNVVGGFTVTDRMLEMFKARQTGRPPRRDPATPIAGPSPIAPSSPVGGPIASPPPMTSPAQGAGEPAELPGSDTTGSDEP